MCDEFTEQDADRALADRGLTRREFAAIGAAVTLAGCAGTAVPGAAGGSLSERMVRITTTDGMADAFFVHPARGRYPGVIMWPDIAGLRDAKRIMARRLAASGYAVLVINPYYRSAPAPVMLSFAEYLQPEGKARVTEYRKLITPDAIARDAKAYVAFLDGQPAVDTARGIGSNGYCMGGPFTVFSCAASPDRVKAAASFHGGKLVGDQPDSPNNLIPATKARFLFAIARNDDAREPDTKTVLATVAKAAQRPSEIEVYPADHGWCVPDSPVYDPVQADRAWERMLALYAEL